MGEVLVDDVGVHEPGDVDDPVVHLPALGPPRHVGDEAFEDVVGADDKLGSTSTQAPRVSGVRRAPSSDRTPGAVATPPSKRVLWKSMTTLYAEIERLFERASAGFGQALARLPQPAGAASPAVGSGGTR